MPKIRRHTYTHGEEACGNVLFYYIIIFFGKVAIENLHIGTRKQWFLIGRKS